MKRDFLQRLSEQTEQLRAEGLFKPERVITSPQGGEISTAGGNRVINLCANNYLGLSSHRPRAKVCA